MASSESVGKAHQEYQELLSDSKLAIQEAHREIKYSRQNLDSTRRSKPVKLPSIRESKMIETQRSKTNLTTDAGRKVKNTQMSSVKSSNQGQRHLHSS